MTTDRPSPAPPLAEPSGVRRFVPLHMALMAFALILLLSALAGVLPHSMTAEWIHGGIRLISLSPGLQLPSNGPVPLYALQLLSGLVALGQFLYISIQVATLTRKRPRLIVEAPLGLGLPLIFSLYGLLIVFGVGMADTAGSAYTNFVLAMLTMAFPASLGVYYAFRIRRDNIWFQHVAQAAPGHLDRQHLALLKAFALGCLVSGLIVYRLAT